MDRIRIEALELDCIVGVRPAERRRRQRLRVDLELSLDLSQAGKSGRIVHTVDYSVVAEEVSALLHFREYQLLEVATEELAAMLLGVHPLVEKVGITLYKPAALRGAARSAAVHIERSREQLSNKREQASFGSIHTLLETHEAVLELLYVAPKQSIVRAPDAARRLEWLVSGKLAYDETPALHHHPQVFSHERPNLSTFDQAAVLFSCTHRPRALEESVGER